MINYACYKQKYTQHALNLFVQSLPASTDNREAECSLSGSAASSLVLSLPTEGIEQQQSELQCSTIPITSSPGRTVLVARQTDSLEWQSPSAPAGSCKNQVSESLQGWGAVCNGTRTGDPWSQLEQQMHINYLELLAVTLVVKSFVKDQKGISVLLQLDN